LTLFGTHLDAGTTPKVRENELISTMEFIRYYNRKHIKESDVVVGCVFLGDLNGGPTKSRFSQLDGRLVNNSEWAEMTQVWEGESFRDYYYGYSDEGKTRADNIEAWTEFQALFIEALQKATKKTESDWRAEHSKIDVIALLKGVKTFLAESGRVLYEEAEVDDRAMEEFLRGELMKQANNNKTQLREKGRYSKVDVTSKDMKQLVKSMKKLVLVPKTILNNYPNKREREKNAEKEGGKGKEKEDDSGREKEEEEEEEGKKKVKYENLVKGTCIDMRKRFRGRFPSETKFNDLDHILIQQTIEAGDHSKRETLLADGHIVMLPEAYRFSDHLGKRAEFRIDWATIQN